MPTQETVFNNYARFEVEGQVDLSAAGAVSAYRGDGITVEKNGTGLYEVTVANPAELKLVKKLKTEAHLEDAAVGTVKDVGVKSLTQQSDGTFLLIVRTVDAAGADVDEAASALTVSFGFVIQTQNMSMPL